MDPVEVFHQWYQRELELTKVRVPSACCLSTVGLDGFPNARMVSLKEVLNGQFMISGPVDSRKGMEIEQSNQVALTFWWTETERQVRIQGTASPLPAKLADKYFAERDRDSRIVSVISRQGQEIRDLSMLIRKFERFKSGKKMKIDRPENWGGFVISPVRIEFLEFSANRFHDRKLYERKDSGWIFKQLQP